MTSRATTTLLAEIRACTVCAAHLPAGPRPIVQFSDTSSLMIIGQAPGARVHRSGVPWDDASGERLREWCGLTPLQFYDPAVVALVPMGFCYPGTGASGDLPPRPECAPLWHSRVLSALPAVRLTVLVGSYAQARYLPATKRQTLTERVRDVRAHLPEFLALPHPSWRSTIWLKKNPWFATEVIPTLREAVMAATATTRTRNPHA